MRAETALQRQLRNYLSLKGYRTVAVPNGTVLRGDKRDRSIQMANLKRDGLTPGFPDLIVFGRDARLAFIEVKTDTGVQSASQIECERWLTEYGNKIAVCRSIGDVDAALSAWGWA